MTLIANVRSLDISKQFVLYYS